jgi:hypothetical protein
VNVTGRGLFSTHDVKAGDLLLCEKTIVYLSGEDANNRMLCRRYCAGLDTSRVIAILLARLKIVNEIVRELYLKLW